MRCDIVGSIGVWHVVERYFIRDLVSEYDTFFTLLGCSSRQKKVVVLVVIRAKTPK